MSSAGARSRTRATACAAIAAIDNSSWGGDTGRVPGLELLPLGIGDAFSTKHYSTCLALRCDGRWLLIDCPHPIRKMVREAAESAGVTVHARDVEAVALTHLHADHASGVEGYGFWFRYVLGQRGRIAAHPAVSKRLWDGHLAGGMEWTKTADGRLEPARFEDFFELIPLDDQAAVRVGPFSIECRRTRHVVPTTAFRIDAGGRTVSFSADTEYDLALVEWLAAADLVIHETGPGIHTPLEKLAALPDPVRRKMRLVHFRDRDELLSANVEPLEQGRLYAI